MFLVMVTRVFFGRYQLKVFESVVAFVVVLMMNVFTWEQRAP
jgi:hypothetical protein